MVNQNLRPKLRERFSRLRGLDGVSYADECRYLLNFIQSNSYCNGLLAELEVSTSIDVLAWINARDKTRIWHFQKRKKSGRGYATGF